MNLDGRKQPPRDSETCQQADECESIAGRRTDETLSMFNTQVPKEEYVPSVPGFRPPKEEYVPSVPGFPPGSVPRKRNTSRLSPGSVPGFHDLLTWRHSINSEACSRVFWSFRKRGGEAGWRTPNLDFPITALRQGIVTPSQLNAQAQKRNAFRLS